LLVWLATSIVCPWSPEWLEYLVKDLPRKDPRITPKIPMHLLKVAHPVDELGTLTVASSGPIHVPAGALIPIPPSPPYKRLDPILQLFTRRLELTNLLSFFDHKIKFGCLLFHSEDSVITPGENITIT
jgi:hypothetical protein